MQGVDWSTLVDLAPLRYPHPPPPPPPQMEHAVYEIIYIYNYQAVLILNYK